MVLDTSPQNYGYDNLREKFTELSSLQYFSSNVPQLLLFIVREIQLCFLEVWNFFIRKCNNIIYQHNFISIILMIMNFLFSIHQYNLEDVEFMKIIA